MSKAIPPSSLSMGDVPDPKRPRGMEEGHPLELPNREIRRKYKKLKNKQHFKDALDQPVGDPSPESATQHQPQPPNVDSAQVELLKHVDVQKFLGILNGLLTGQKKLVIESKAERQIVPSTASAGAHSNGLIDYTHTFCVKDARNA